MVTRIVAEQPSNIDHCSVLLTVRRVVKFGSQLHRKPLRHIQTGVDTDEEQKSAERYRTDNHDQLPVISRRRISTGESFGRRENRLDAIVGVTVRAGGAAYRTRLGNVVVHQTRQERSVLKVRVIDEDVERLVRSRRRCDRRRLPVWNEQRHVELGRTRDENVVAKYFFELATIVDRDTKVTRATGHVT